MKFLVAGFGSIGRRHLRNLRALGQTDLTVLRSGHGTLTDSASDLQGVRVVTRLEDALAHPPQGVIIANPTALHLDVAIPAARAGCHILLEKPIAADLTRVEELRTALETGGGQLLVGFQFRFHPTLLRARQLIEEQALGRIYFTRLHWGEYLPDWHPWEDYRQGYAARADLGGGVLRTLCHPFDTLRMLLGPYQVVSALGGTVGDLDLQVEDLAEVGLRFDNQALGALHVDYLQQPPAHTLSMYGTQGTLEWNNADGSLRLFRRGMMDWEVFSPPPGFERNQLFLAEMEHFLQVMRGNATPQCTLEDGIAALHAVLEAEERLIKTS